MGREGLFGRLLYSREAGRTTVERDPGALSEYELTLRDLLEIQTDAIKEFESLDTLN